MEHVHHITLLPNLSFIWICHCRPTTKRQTKWN